MAIVSALQVLEVLARRGSVSTQARRRHAQDSADDGQRARRRRRARWSPMRQVQRALERVRGELEGQGRVVLRAVGHRAARARHGRSRGRRAASQRLAAQ